MIQRVYCRAGDFDVYWIFFLLFFYVFISLLNSHTSSRGSVFVFLFKDTSLEFFFSVQRGRSVVILFRSLYQALSVSKEAPVFSSSCLFYPPFPFLYINLELFVYNVQCGAIHDQCQCCLKKMLI